VDSKEDVLPRICTIGQSILKIGAGRNRKKKVLCYYCNVSMESFILSVIVIRWEGLDFLANYQIPPLALPNQSLPWLHL
jgi:hypothetical protein